MRWWLGKLVAFVCGRADDAATASPGTPLLSPATGNGYGSLPAPDSMASPGKRCWMPEFKALSSPLDVPLSLGFYATVRGLENLLVYMWILKDLCWTQNWTLGLLISSVAVSLFGLLMVFSLYMRCFDEAWHYAASFLWLFGNTWWMSGEIADWYSPNSAVKVYDSRKLDCQHVMEGALAWILLYYVVVRPLDLFERLGLGQRNNPAHRKYFYNAGVKPRFPCLSSWRQYEQLHIVFWLGKDFAWNTATVPLWYVCSIATLLMALDFVWESAQQEGMGVEFAHYLSTFVWIVGNMAWAVGEIFYPERDYPFSLFSASSDAYETARWYSAWLLVLATVPVLVLLVIWGLATRDGSIQARHVAEGVEEGPAKGESGTTENPLWEPV